MGISFWQIAIVVVLVDTSANNQDDNSKSDKSDTENK